ncbi:hypothetical protein AB0O29_34750, partial [Streptomyces sp. NPDC089915]
MPGEAGAAARAGPEAVTEGEAAPDRSRLVSRAPGTVPEADGRCPPGPSGGTVPAGRRTGAPSPVRLTAGPFDGGRGAATDGEGEPGAAASADADGLPAPGASARCTAGTDPGAASGVPEALPAAAEARCATGIA